MSFVIKESFKLILRSKLNFFLNLISLTLCVLLIVLSFYLIRASKFLQEYVQQNISLNIFINDNVNDESLNNFAAKLKNQPFTSKIEFISKERAAEIFLKETGEDFRKILDYNPLPASYTLYLKNEYTNKDSLNKIVSDIQKEEIVTEVVSKMEFLQKVIAFSEKVKLYIFIFTGFMLLVSIYLVYSTVKLIMNSKYEELETMKLVGAKLSTIKLPIIFNIILIGLLSGTISILISFSVISYFNIDYNLLLKMTELDFRLFIVLILLIGPFIGSIVTTVALRKISLRV
ncbi:Cell division protein [Ignavibacterium album JCM 16511]|uniref:Cell division protein FtsX n=1 Tax=Ignavibacterium album (strain DSM 19864 / JCM 16511 / NBRC 101810 / Mat9-16) TaxID=945713 RepID=I0ALD5_IGNAJ|nr:permease-like cell division protein FtsX [Ignavibacterium album]AFH49792.1 Cell division protein [Ignavibacterium album JCM 16511]